MGRKKRFDDDDIQTEIATSPDPVVTAPELAEDMEYSADNIRLRLSEMEGSGLVKSRKVGAHATVWWITPKGREELA